MTTHTYYVRYKVLNTETEVTVNSTALFDKMLTDPSDIELYTAHLAKELKVASKDIDITCITYLGVVKEPTPLIYKLMLGTLVIYTVIAAIKLFH
mgnify:CR=1 FL=1